MNRQLVRAKMFDNLIGNKDPNLGNWLVDGDWHLLLIDHSRAFTSMKTLVHKIDNVDRGLWEKFLALDEASLQPTLGNWMGKGELRAVLERRDKMKEEIDRLVKQRGETVFLPCRGVLGLGASGWGLGLESWACLPAVALAKAGGLVPDDVGNPRSPAHKFHQYLDPQIPRSLDP